MTEAKDKICFPGLFVIERKWAVTLILSLAGHALWLSYNIGQIQANVESRLSSLEEKERKNSAAIEAIPQIRTILASLETSLKYIEKNLDNQMSTARGARR